MTRAWRPHRGTEMPQGIGLQPVKRELEIFAAESCWPAMVRYTADKAGNRSYPRSRCCMTAILKKLRLFRHDGLAQLNGFSAGLTILLCMGSKEVLFMM